MEISERLKTLLLQIPSARLASDGREVVMRCPYCGDSKKDRNEAHFYVSLGHNEEPSLFHCFRANCLASGITTQDKLIEWGVYDLNTAIELTKYNKQVLSLNKNKKFKDIQIYRINNAYISDNELSKVKLKYINNRLGLQLDYNDLLSKKIVLNIKDLLQCNNITNLTKPSYLIDQLDESFIGFLSQDNAFINMKNLRPGKVNKSIDKRYINYNIFGKVDNTQKYYTLPTTIDLCNPNRIKVNIAEGPFDILSIYYNLRKDDNNSIYSAILGGGYLGICKHFIHSMKLINLEFHIYMDNDVEFDRILDIHQYLKVYRMPLYIHRNNYTGEKDFGIKITNINENVQLIK